MDSGNSYQQSLEYLFHQLPIFSHLGKSAYKADLVNITRLCNLLENPQEKFKTVHVAGTNGKGSVSHMLAAIFQTAGYRTGLYTSPHLKDFRERIRINGEMIDKAFVTDFIDRIKPLTIDLEPSFFEFTVAMAFDYFWDRQVDIAIIETGLGGRLDSTNIIKPDLSVITNISYDHQNILGDTLQQIAGEKAGIIKQNVPVVIGQYQEEVSRVFLDKAEMLQSPIFFSDREYQAVSVKWTPGNLEVIVNKTETGEQKSYNLDLNGQYQALNLLTVLSTCDHMRALHWKLPEEKIRIALSRVKTMTGLQGRWDILSENPMVVLDVAHNEGGILEVRKQVGCMHFDQLHIVLGTVRDKDTDRILEALPQKAIYYFCKAKLPRALDENELVALARTHNLSGNPFSTVSDALEAAKEKAGPTDLILVCGSCFVVGELV